MLSEYKFMGRIFLSGQDRLKFPQISNRETIVGRSRSQVLAAVMIIAARVGIEARISQHTANSMELLESFAGCI